jgi:hypothetical protein
MPDFNGAPEQREGGLIPEETICVVHMTVRPGNAGEGGWLKRSKIGDSLAIDAEFTVVEGANAKRKFWKLFTIEGASEGHQRAGEISASQLRAILESARGVRPDDESEQAKAARRVASWGDFNGLRFIAKIGIEKGKDGYKDKNTLDAAITPDRKAWHRVEQVVQPVQGMTTAGAAAAGVVAKAATAPTGKPSWAA